MGRLGEGSEKLKEMEMKDYTSGLRVLSLEKQTLRAAFIMTFKARKADSRGQ